MSNPAQPLARRLLPFMVGTALLITALIASWRVIGLRDLAIRQEHERLQGYLQEQVVAWEEDLIKDLDEAIEVVAQDPFRAPQRQARMRRNEAWFNALYIWRPPQAGPGRTARPPTMIFPIESTQEDDHVWSQPCLQRARWMVQDPSIDPIQSAAAYEVGCASEDLLVRLVAATEAATLLDGTGQLPLAIEVLDLDGLPEGLSIPDGIQLGLPPFRVATYQVLRASLEMKLGRDQLALDRLAQVGKEITALDAPDAVPVLHYVDYPILAQLRRFQRTEDAERISAALSRAARRVVAYREIAERILVRPLREDEPGRFVYDQYSDRPFLLYYGMSSGLGVGLQLEQSTLLAHFLNHRMRGLRRMVTITDAKGEWVAGARRGGEITVTTPFEKTLTHLRVGVREGAVEAVVERMDDQWILPVGVLIVCTALGFWALWVWERASRQQLELMSRQRAFTTRVTHELKTPLAGIRVMAENLEMGAFGSDEERRSMAQRIVDEADRLSARVDEVLAVARERTIPDPVPFDPEEVIFEVIDQWGPRYESVGLELEADMDPTELVSGDPVALRDAVSCLLDNALKYRREDRDDAKVWLGLREDGSKVIIDVADNGLGVPKTMRKSIFERFVRVEGPNRGKAGGHGLGLHQVQEIVKAHKGQIFCTDGVDGGARFVISLPAVKA